MHSSSCCLLQVDCTPTGDIVIRVLEYRPTLGSYIKITPLETAGVATVSSVDYKASSAAVRHSPITVHLHAVFAHQPNTAEVMYNIQPQFLIVSCMKKLSKSCRTFLPIRLFCSAAERACCCLEHGFSHCYYTFTASHLHCPTSSTKFALLPGMSSQIVNNHLALQERLYKVALAPSFPLDSDMAY